MVEHVVPVHIGRTRRNDRSAEEIAEGVAAMVRYRIAVIDREDRLEVGTGTWTSTFLADTAGRSEALREVTLRALQIGFDPVNFGVLRALAGDESMATAELEARTGLGRVALGDRVGDLVSAGLAAKVPEADQVVGTGAGRALVAFVDQIVESADRRLEDPR